MSGEREGRRKQMDTSVKNWTSRGMSPEKAKAKAKECAVRADRRDDKTRK